MRVQHNIPAMNAYRNYNNNTKAIAKNLEKLSSGYRVNRAGDDAAGLAISEKMRAQITGLKTAQKNAKDGISLIQTAEGALTEVHSMLNRMFELAEQSANGTYDNEVDRANLQKEFDALRTEIDRIADSSNFNGQKLLDGSLGGGSSVDGLTGAAIASFKGAATGDLTGLDASTTSVTETKEVVEYDLDDGLLAQGNNIVIGGVTIDATNTGGHVAGEADGAADASIDVSVATDTAAQAQAIADILNSKTGVAGAQDWTWSVDGDKLVATAKEAGAIAGDGPADALGDATGTGGPTPEATVKTAGLDAEGVDFSQADTVMVDGVEVKVDWSALTDEEKAVLQKNWSDGSASADDVKKASQLIQDTINKSIDKTNAQKGTNVAHVKVEGTYADGVAATFKITSGQKDGDSKIEFTGGDHTALGQIFGTTKQASNDPVTTLGFNPADISNGKFTMKIGNESVEVALGALDAGSTADDVMAALNTAITDALTKYDAAQGTTGTDNAISGKITAKLNANGAIEFTNTSGKEFAFMDKDGGEAAKTLGIAKGTAGSGSGGLTLQIGDTADSFNMMNVSINDMHCSALGIDASLINIGEQGQAQSAMDAIKNAIDSVSSTRGDLGALQNRLDHTINNLAVMQENIQDAEATIRDTDVAEEMMAYTKNNILVQSAQAMLAQANQLPQGVLQLLG